MLGQPYDTQAARATAAAVMQHICETAYRTSIELARAKGSFPVLDSRKHVAGAFIRQLPEDIRNGITRHGIRELAPDGYRPCRHHQPAGK